MSLLLVFRTNAAFARFCNAADSFADVLASTRNLSRKMAVWAPASHRRSLARLCAAIPWSVKHRGQGAFFFMYGRLRSLTSCFVHSQGSTGPPRLRRSWRRC